ncbi:MAG: hypothetical protein ACTSXA_10125 [Candidatus Heimdallarchaeota archaeon]
MISSKQISILLLFSFINSCFFLPFIPVTAESVEFTHQELAYYWAPVWYQDTHSSDYPADYITNFDFDNNWIGNDNWDNQPLFPLPAYIYYSVVETSTHIFIGYYDFHPRDWDFFPHENDLEGVLIVIQKGDTPQGDFLLMETEAHNVLLQYTDHQSSPSNTVLNKGESIDGDVQFESVTNYDITLPFDPHDHPIVYVEDQGHGVYGAKRWENNDFPNDDGVIYKPKGLAEEPSNGNDRNVGYELLSISALWDRRFIMDSTTDGEKTFERFGIFDGNDGRDDSAKAPWGWDDSNDGTTYTGEIFYNPIDMINVHLSIQGEFSFYYTFNPYAVIVRLDEYKVNEKEIFDIDVKGYLNLFMFDGEGRYTWKSHEDGVLDVDDGTQASWKGDFPIGVWIDMHTKIGRPFYGINYYNHPYFGIRSKEWRILSDPWLMDVEETHWYGSSSFTNANYEPSFPIFIGENHLYWGKSELRLTIYFNHYSEMEWSISTIDTPLKITLLWIIFGVLSFISISSSVIIIIKRNFS